MIHLSLVQALSLWSDLLDAEYGQASHGRDAEVYAFRLMSRDPCAEGDAFARAKHDDPAPMYSEAAAAQRVRAARSLVALVEHFAAERSVSVLIDGEMPRAWLDHRGASFDHRVHVRVEGRTA